MSNDDFYVVRAPDKSPASIGLPRNIEHQRMSGSSKSISKGAGPQRPKALNPKAKTDVTNADVLEEKHPVVAFLFEKLQHDPDNAQNHYALATIYHRMRIFDKACLEYQKALEAEPGNADYYESLARLWRDWGTPESGISYLRKALELRPSYPEAWNTLGTIHDELGHFSQAQRCYLKAIEINSELDFVHSNLCFHYLQTGELQEAIYHGEKAVRLNPSFTQARNNLGAAYGVAGDSAKAIEQFKLTGDEAEAHNNLGVLLLKAQRNAEAIEEFKLAVRLRPFYPVAAQNYRIARGLVLANHPLPRQSRLRLARWLASEFSLRSDSPDVSIPAVDLWFMRECGYLWANYPQPKGCVKTLTGPGSYAVKEHELSRDVALTTLGGRQPTD